MKRAVWMLHGIERAYLSLLVMMLKTKTTQLGIILITLLPKNARAWLPGFQSQLCHLLLVILDIPLDHSLFCVFLFKMRLVIIVSEGLNELILRKYLEQSLTQHKHQVVCYDHSGSVLQHGKDGHTLACCVSPLSTFLFIMVSCP